MKINVTKEEFMSRAPEERDWMVFLGVTQINGSGCQWAKSRWRKLYVIGAGAGLAGGFLAILAKIIFNF